MYSASESKSGRNEGRCTVLVRVRAGGRSEGRCTVLVRARVVAVKVYVSASECKS